MVKDRLDELKQFQNKKEKNKKLKETSGGADIIGQWIQQLEKNNQDVRIYLKRINDMKFNQKDNADKLQSCFQNNTSLAQQIYPKLKQVDNELKEIKKESAEKKIKYAEYTTSKKRFHDAFIENNTLLENYKTISKQIIKSQLVAKGHFHVTDEEVTLLLEEGDDVQVFTENILAETAEAKRILVDVEERHQQLLQIEKMLLEVRDMFVQMAVLIENQQELVDRIEDHVQNAANDVGDGAANLNEGRKKKNKYLRRKLYILIAVIILILIILIISLKGI